MSTASRHSTDVFQKKIKIKRINTSGVVSHNQERIRPVGVATARHVPVPRQRVGSTPLGIQRVGVPVNAALPEDSGRPAGDDRQEEAGHLQNRSQGGPDPGVPQPVGGQHTLGHLLIDTPIVELVSQHTCDGYTQVRSI